MRVGLMPALFFGKGANWPENDQSMKNQID
jgi:hypothetical protein